MRFKNAYPTRGRLVLALRAPAGPDGRAIRPRRRGPGDRAGAARARQRLGDRRAGARADGSATAVQLRRVIDLPDDITYRYAEARAATTTASTSTTPSPAKSDSAGPSCRACA